MEIGDILIIWSAGLHLWSSKTWILNRNHQNAGILIRNIAFVSLGPLLSCLSDAERHVLSLHQVTYIHFLLPRAKHILKEVFKRVSFWIQCDSNFFLLATRVDKSGSIGSFGSISQCWTLIFLPAIPLPAAFLPFSVLPQFFLSLIFSSPFLFCFPFFPILFFLHSSSSCSLHRLLKYSYFSLSLLVSYSSSFLLPLPLIFLSPCSPSSSLCVFSFPAFLSILSLSLPTLLLVSTFPSVPFPSVLGIRDILVPIRIRESVPLTKGSGSCYFRHWHSRLQQKTIALFFPSFQLITHWRYIHFIFQR